MRLGCARRASGVLRTVELRNVGGPSEVPRGGLRAGEEEGALSISPAELGAAALMVEAVGRFEHELGGDLEIRQFVGRGDNLGSCHAVNTRRVRSYPMHAGLECVEERELKWRLRRRLEHTPTKESRVADLLARGKLQEAIELVRREMGRCEQRWLPAGVVEDMERRIREACLKER